MTSAPCINKQSLSNIFLFRDLNHDNRSNTDANDVEEFQSANEEVEDSNPEKPSSYPCDQCPDSAEVWGSKEALNFHLRTAHHKMDCSVPSLQAAEEPDYRCEQCSKIWDEENNFLG